MEENSTERKCLVCGAKARGVNFNALTCNSCKTFFKRTVIKQRETECDNESNCPINVTSRRNCKHCRLAKCLAVGMSRELVQFHYANNPFKNQSELMGQRVRTQVELPLNVPLQRLLHQPQMYDELHLSEIRAAVRPFSNEREGSYLSYALNQKEGINAAVPYLKQFVGLCHSILAFRNLDSAKQLKLVKSSIHSLLSTWFMFQYDAKRNGMVVFANNSFQQTICLDVDICFDGKTRGYFRKKIEKFYSLMQDDPEIRNLLLPVMLFYSCTNGTDESDYIRYQFFLYARLLRNYLLRKHKSSMEADLHFQELLQQVEENRITAQNVRNMYLEIGTNHIATEMIEIYDLV